MRDLEGGGGGGEKQRRQRERERESASNWTLTTSCPLHRVTTGRQRGARQPASQPDWQKTERGTDPCRKYSVLYKATSYQVEIASCLFGGNIYIQRSSTGMCLCVYAFVEWWGRGGRGGGII